MKEITFSLFEQRVRHILKDKIFILSVFARKSNSWASFLCSHNGTNGLFRFLTAQLKFLQIKTHSIDILNWAIILLIKALSLSVICRHNILILWTGTFILTTLWLTYQFAIVCNESIKMFLLFFECEAEVLSFYVCYR